MKQIIVRHELVEYLPESLKEGVLYVSFQFGTAAHRCCCGCGQEVVTPLGPTGWQLTVEAGAISLFPSVGNWALPCQSHYWIRRNKVLWAAQWADSQIAASRTVRAHAIAAVQYAPWTKLKGWLRRVWERWTDDKS